MEIYEVKFLLCRGQAKSFIKFSSDIPKRACEWVHFCWEFVVFIHYARRYFILSLFRYFFQPRPSFYRVSFELRPMPASAVDTCTQKSVSVGGILIDWRYPVVFLLECAAFPLPVRKVYRVAKKKTPKWKILSSAAKKNPPRNFGKLGGFIFSRRTFWEILRKFGG